MIKKMWNDFKGYSVKGKIAVLFFPAIILIAGIDDLGFFDSAELKAEKKMYASRCFKNGQNSDINVEIRMQLKDPSSFEHVSTTTAPVENGLNTVKVNFRAKNGFGGYTQSTAMASIDNSSCKITGKPLIIN